jgi:hypothetical protein
VAGPQLELRDAGDGFGVEEPARIFFFDGSH